MKIIDDNSRTAPTLKPFDNLVTVLIATVVVAIIVIGMLVAFYMVMFGLPIVFIGAMMLAFGLTKHSTDKPREAGLLTLWDSPIRFGGKNIVVGGTTILAEYLPFKIGSIKIAMDNKDHEFKMTILSSDKIPMNGKVSITACPDIEDLEDYVQAGNDLDRIFAQIDEIVYQEVQVIVTENSPQMEALYISSHGKVISELLEGRLQNNLFQRRSFGIRIINVRVDFPMPEDIQKGMRDVGIEKYQKQAEVLDSRTITAVAREMQRDDAIQYLPIFDGLTLADMTPDQIKLIDSEISKPGGLLERGKVKPFEHYRERAERRRLIKDNKVTVIEGAKANFSWTQG